MSPAPPYSPPVNNIVPPVKKPPLWARVVGTLIAWWWTKGDQ